MNACPVCSAMYYDEYRLCLKYGARLLQAVRETPKFQQTSFID